MASDKRKEFLNAGILGDKSGVPDRRGFRAIKTEYIDSPRYDARFFETFPTAWASAYAFQKALAAERQKDQSAPTPAGDDDAATLVATEEWMCLFLLHYWGRAQLVEYAQAELEERYDRDLWLALHGTYPSARPGGLAAINLLETNDGTVIGAYYPDVIFFPSRSRSGWADDKVLSTYLVGTRLSWEQCRKDLLNSDRKIAEFHAHMLRVAQLLRKSFKERVEKFCLQHFGGDVQLSGGLDPDPMKWDDIPGNMPPSQHELLERYPLRKPNREGGFTYFLLTGMPYRSHWMTSALLSGCSPLDYRRTGEYEITVQVGKRQVACKLTERKDSIVLLKDLFLTDQAYWCKVSRSADHYTGKLRLLHKIELRDPALRQDEVAVCLAPIRREFLTHFPQVFENLNGVAAVSDLQRPVIDWVFPVLGHEVRWRSEPTIQVDMPKTSLALWPPKVSRKWRFYVARGRGSKADCGRWHLVDENGSEGTNIELDAEEYVSILQRPGTANQPKALLFTDNNDRERGVLFLVDLEEQNVDTEERSKATLAVDFGTSNTCLAYKRGGRSAILTFRLSPDMLWNKRAEFESPGFVPFEWAGRKGFFPTLLLSRRSDPRLEELRSESEVPPEYLFKVDIPGLHYNMEDNLLDGEYNRKWETHTNLKWELRTQTPWRSLFLHLTLLYAHAELFFTGAQGAEISKYVFTYPLAFGERDQEGFHTEARKAIKRIRQMCYGTDPTSDQFSYVSNVDESTAIARAVRATATPNLMEVFVDVGGGTADIALRSGENFLVLDSIKVAGNTFFRFAKRNFTEEMIGAPEFRKHLARLLRGLQDSELTISEDHLDLGTYYSLSINRLPEDEFKRREGVVLDQGMGPRQGSSKGASYQQYRARLFFRHILTYALLQACATCVSGRRVPERGVKLILGGNGWGLMMFAGLERKRSTLLKEAQFILELLKKNIGPTLAEEERKIIEQLQVSDVELLNEGDLSGAKTAVSLGALNLDAGGQSDKEQARPYSGITIEGLRINQSEPITVRWYERWGFNEFVSKVGAMDQIQDAHYDEPASLKGPLDPSLRVFTSLGNAGQPGTDNMPEGTWQSMNAEIGRDISSLKGDRVEGAPINHFLSGVLYPEDETRDYIDVLAEINRNFKANGK